MNDSSPRLAWIQWTLLASAVASLGVLVVLHSRAVPATLHDVSPVLEQLEVSFPFAVRFIYAWPTRVGGMAAVVVLALGALVAWLLRRRRLGHALGIAAIVAGVAPSAITWEGLRQARALAFGTQAWACPCPKAIECAGTCPCACDNDGRLIVQVVPAGISVLEVPSRITYQYESEGRVQQFRIQPTAGSGRERICTVDPPCPIDRLRSCSMNCFQR